ncbi:STAS/SEC14 domain-containing protein [Pontibacter actiniarum]|uniref:STAS/SEC14 domain-containing protein n=1 Tax=Pontibacter actiniarum TaxID=323450 RepID=A0A1X9YUR8_9BACT|nr:STAS/SEC14 domain-containing protein [Pontibacter actiniarum]ARS36635.1 STAS/SEC14 domain-containing protein [Pontibacter actiniarum]
MISTVHFEEENIAGFHLQHYIDDSGMRALVHEMEEKASRADSVSLYFVFENFGDWDSVQSFFDTLKLRFNNWGKIARYAIVTDKAWVKKQSRLANFLTPHFEVRAFGMADKEQALAWLKQPAANAGNPGIAVLEAMPDHVVGLATIGQLTSSDYHTIDHLLEEHVQQNRDLRLYLEVLHPNGTTPAGMWEELRHGVKYHGKFSKVAIAGHEDWLQKAQGGEGAASDTNMKLFKLDERDTAIDWLR